MRSCKEALTTNLLAFERDRGYQRLTRRLEAYACASPSYPLENRGESERAMAITASHHVGMDS